MFYKAKNPKNLALFFCYLVPTQLLTEPVSFVGLVLVANLVGLAAFG
jgi:hypothetical protein